MVNRLIERFMNPLRGRGAALLLGLVLSLSAASGFAQTTPALSAFVDRTDISINDIITLTIRTDASLGNTRPQLEGLNRSFEQVGGSSSRSTYTNNNGNIQSWNEFSISLRPLTTGALTIPAIRVGTETTVPITINVREASAAPIENNDEIFIQSLISKTEAYVQEQLIYTIKIYYSIGFDQGAQLSSPQVANAVVQQLGSDDNYQEVVNGIGYNVTERRFVIYPQSSGELSIPPVYFTASVGRRTGLNRFLNNPSRMREINLASDTHMLRILPRPASFPANATWLPAADLQLVESWSGPLENVPVGEAVTRNIVLTTSGLGSSLLPGIEYTPQSGLKFYPDQPVREDQANREGVIGKRSEGTAIVASDPGVYQLPEVRLPWWNTTTNTLETAILPARTLVVPEPTGDLVQNNIAFVPIAGQQSPLTPSAAATSSGNANPLWIGTTIGFACLWLFSTMLWLRSRRDMHDAVLVLPQMQSFREPAQRRGKASAQKTADADACLRVLHTACASNNLHDVRAALLKWGQASFATESPMTLAQLAQRCGEPRFAELAQALDNALYGKTQDGFNSKELYTEVAALHRRGVNRESGDKFALPPLYKA